MQIQTTKKGEVSVSDYFNKMKKLADSLAVGGNPLSSNELIMHLLTGLDDSYESLVTNILTRLEKEHSTVEEVYSMMLSHEIRLEMNKGKSQTKIMHDMSAHFAKKGRNFNNSNYSNQKNDNTSAGTGFNNNKNIICQICFIPGHGVYKCKNRFNQSFVPRNRAFCGFRRR